MANHGITALFTFIRWNNNKQKGKKMTEILNNEQIQEPILEDGQTDNIPPPIPEQFPLEQQNQPKMIQSACGNELDSEFYTKSEFYENFKSVFKFASDVSGLESFKIKEKEEVGAKITSDRFYEMAEKYAFMRPLIRKNTTRVMETILMIQFVAGKASDVYKEKTNINLGSLLWKKAKKALGIKHKTEKDTDFSAQAVAEKQQKQDK